MGGVGSSGLVGSLGGREVCRMEGWPAVSSLVCDLSEEYDFYFVFFFAAVVVVVCCFAASERF